MKEREKIQGVMEYVVLVVVAVEAVVVTGRGTGAPGSNGVRLRACGDGYGGCSDGGDEWRRERRAIESDEGPWCWFAVLVLVVVVMVVILVIKRWKRDTR